MPNISPNYPRGSSLVLADVANVSNASTPATLAALRRECGFIFHDRGNPSTWPEFTSLTRIAQVVTLGWFYEWKQGPVQYFSYNHP